MPDWITHILVAWSLCTILGFKYKQFNPGNTAIAMIGALLPDMVKIYIPIQLFTGNDISVFVAPFHMPLGSLILAGMFTLFFKEKKIIYLFLVLGIVTHFALDLLMIYSGGGIYLLYPLSFNQWQMGLITYSDYQITILVLIFAVLVYGFSRFTISDAN